MTFTEVRVLTERISMTCLGNKFTVTLDVDKKYGRRLFIQVAYTAPCTKTGKIDVWKGRKFYLSSHMTPDEVVKTCYSAFRMAVEHEVMEGFKVDGNILFNPHTPFEELLKISHLETTRNEPDVYT